MSHSQSPSRPDSSGGHLSLGLGARGAGDFQFGIKTQRTVGAFAASFLIQASVVVALYVAGRTGLQHVGVLPRQERIAFPELVYVKAHLQTTKPGGGGGGGNKRPDPPKKAEAKGLDRITVPTAPEIVLVPTPVEPPPVQLARIDVPVKSMASGLQESLGAITAVGPLTTSRGSGSGSGAGSGIGSGDGPGKGSGIGPGSDGGTGGVQGPGSGATPPEIIRKVDPQYTPEAMLARVQGEVWVACVIRANGKCTEPRVVKVPDPALGLDGAAIRAIEQWTFRPAMKAGQPVAYLATIALEFSLR